MTSPLGLGHRRRDVTSPGPTTNHDDDDSIGNKAATAAPEAAQSLSLMHLPPEMHVAISDFLTYPDALSLKHTNRHFYSLVDTDFELKIEWLLQRRSLHLECPSNHRCALGSDLRFCRGSVPSVHPSRLRIRLG
ncbi:F-box domain protein [Geosmithia morbida]|uniref:F-box domain protein n=1 Tax=Geosmithia morbida TaxID=1094350 RepID=A0A9P4Z1F2_9HYPO|nr:F-box domain protein [Geosmithia morbida]KAF4126936.1 F-box domain protein [Geosmithia morbida]